MMLDLKFLLFHEASSKQGKFLPEGSGGGHMYDSGSSNSSVFNAEGCSIIDDEDSSRSALQFDILNASTGGEEDEVELDGEDHGFDSEVCSLTRQLFPPMSPASVPGVIKAARSTSFMQHLVDFRFCQADSSTMTEVKLLHPQQPQKSRRGPKSRSSQYRGVTFYRRTGRWESHIWDCGKQVYLGGFDTAHVAARAYDRAAIKFRGVEADINFNLSDYEEDMKQMKNLSKEEFVHILRRQRTGFSKGSTKFRGVTLHKCGRWEARMGQFLGKKAHDKAAIKCNGREAVTNFEPSVYESELLPQDDGEAAGHDIDLNLSISQPSMCNSKRVDNQTGIQLRCGSFETFNVDEIKINYPSSIAIVQSHHLALASEHPQARTNVFPGFFTTSEGSTTSKKMLTGSPALPSCACQIHCPSAPPQFSCAASSGFSPATVILTDALQPPPADPFHLQLLPRATSHNFWS